MPVSTKKTSTTNLGFLTEVSDAKLFRQSDENLDKLKKKFDSMDDGPANTFMRKGIAKEVKRREGQKRKEMLNPTVQIKDEFEMNEGKNPSRRPSFSLMIMKAKKTKRDEYGDPIKSDGSYAGKKNEDN